MNKINKLLLFAAMTILLGLSAVLPAQAQIAFRSAAQATSAAGTIGTITFVAAGAQTVGTGASITPVIPGGTAAGDFAVLIVAGRPSDTSEPAAPAGWTFRSSSLREVGAEDLKIMTFYRVLAGGDANPTVTLPANWQGAARGMSGQIAVWRGVGTTTPFDVADVTGSTAAIRDWIPPAITTVTNGAWAVSAVASSDDSDINVRTANGFTGRMTRTAYNTTTGGDHAIAVADAAQATAGLVSMIEWRQEANAAAPYVSITFALRPALATLTIAVPAGTTTGDVMVASIVVRPCSNTNGGACTVTLTAPAGWIQVGTTINQTGGGGTGGFGNRLAIYQRVVTGVEPANYTWTFGGTPAHAGAVGAISTYSGVDTASPIVVQGGQATANAYTHATPDIDTGAVTDTMLVATHAANSGATWTPPGGMTEAADGSSLTPTNDLGLSMEVSYALRAVAGLTGTRTATHSNPPASDTGATHLLALRPLPTVNHFSISHAGSGVACDVHTITITAHNAAHSPVSAGGLTVNLSTSNSKGTWTGIVAGGGTLSDPTAGDGAATYTFAAGSSSVQLSFRYANLAATSETFGFNVSGGGFTEATGTATAGDDPSFTMAQAGFRFRNIEDGNTTILTQLSGKPSNTGFNARTVRIQAINTNTVTGACTALFASQTRTVELGAECNSPTTCAGQVVTINATNIATSNDNAATGAAAYTGVSLTFDVNSEAPTVITYPDAGQISLHARYDLDAAVAGFEMLGSSNLFVVRPFGLTFPGIAHSNTAAGALLGAAGDNFSMTVRGYRWAAGEDADNDGVPDAGVNITDNGTVPNFAATATVGRSANLPGIALGAVSRGATCAGAATVVLSGGTATATDWCYSEAGNVILTANVSNYITAGINITGNSGLDGGGSGGYVGRFRPKQFAVSGAARTNRTLAACGTASSFSYMDEGLTLAFTLTAQNTQGATTQNYTGTYAKHDPTTGGNNAKTAFGIGARNVAPFAALTARVSGAYVTSPPTWANGVLTVTGANAARVAVGRPSPDDPPDGPYAQVQFGIAPTDTDNVLMNAYDLDVDNAGGNDHTLTAPLTAVRYGRLRLGAASGSQLQPLRVPVEAQYWNGTFWITNVDDGCTPLLTTNVGLGNYIRNPPAGTGTTTVTAVTSSLSAGRGSITLGVPAADVRSVDVAVNLDSAAATASACPAFAPAATAANKTYLRGMWCGTTHTKDPSTRARFGIRRGSDETIYLRENYN